MSLGALRQRNIPQNATNQELDPFTVVNYNEAHLSARALLAASLIHSAAAMKMHFPVMYTFLPVMVQWFLSSCC